MEKNIRDSKMGFEPADLGVLSNLLSQLESVGKFQSRQGFWLDCLVIPKLFHFCVMGTTKTQNSWTLLRVLVIQAV